MTPNLKNDIENMLKGLRSIAEELPKAIERGFENHPDKEAYKKALQDGKIIEKAHEELHKMKDLTNLFGKKS